VASPTRRALLIGASAPDLAGVANDLELMGEALARHGFEAEHMEAVLPATRARMADAIQRLIARTESDDVVVLYYSGHGAKLDRDRTRGDGEAAYHRFLVASDFEASTDDDFRGYTNAELSLDLDALTRKSKNVIAIMDCCHAGRVFRDSKPEAVERIVWQDTSRQVAVRNLTVTGRWARAAEHHYQRLRATRGLELDKRDAEANPHVVRLLASASEGRAYEVATPRPAGAMTVALHNVLMTIDPTRTTWQDIGRLIRQTPRRGGGDQRVVVEGPHRRLLFSLIERCEFGEVNVDASDGQVWLCGGRLAGLLPGDRHELRALGDRGSFVAIGDAEVTSVSSSHAEVQTTVDPARLLAGGSARPLSHRQARAAIELIDFARPERELLRARIEASGFVRVQDHPENGDLPVVGQLHHEDGRVQLRTRGLAFDVPRSFSVARAPASAEHFAEHFADAVHRLARAACLGRLPPPTEAERLAPDWQLEVGMQPDNLLTLRLQPSRSVFLSALLIGPDSRIEVLTQAQGGGVEVEPGIGYVLGQRSASTTVPGQKLVRPSTSVIASTQPLPVTVVAVISDQIVDLRSWEQSGIPRFVARDPLASKDVTRKVKRQSRRARAARYHLEIFHFEVQ
jgi:hypothetical protein